VRHAQPGKNYEHLSEKGKEQAKKLQSALRHEGYLGGALHFASRMSRAIATAEIASPKNFCVDERLNELNNGKDMLQTLRVLKAGKTPEGFEEILTQAEIENETFLNDLLSLGMPRAILFTHQFRAISILMKLHALENTASTFWEAYKKYKLDFASFTGIKV